ncbi:MAG TPA: hypothetical protein VM864_09625 [Pyrinomonadaceae bacterium]|jgi:hypothetical protein|nr:hypothetical protein [Pyrinomonadaceae bacterium]
MKPAPTVRQLSLQGFEERGAGRASDATHAEPTAARAASPAVVARADGSSLGRSPNADLLGRTFSDGASQVTVRGVSATNPAHVVVEREHDGHTWTIHAGIVRMIVSRPRRRHAA